MPPQITCVSALDMCANHVRVGGGMSSPDDWHRRHADPILAAAAFPPAASASKRYHFAHETVFCYTVVAFLSYRQACCWHAKTIPV